MWLLILTQIVLSFETSDAFEAETCGIMTTTGSETKYWG